MNATKDLRVLYVSASDRTDVDLPAVFREAIATVGVLSILANVSMSQEELVDAIRQSDVFLTCRHSVEIPPEIATDPGNLRLVVATVGSLRRYVPLSIITAGVAVCNWGDAPADEIAVGTLTLTLAVLADLHHHIQERRRGTWKIDEAHHGGRLSGERVGLYGFGLIARRFWELLRPFNCQVLVYDPYATELPGDVDRAKTLDELFSGCRIVSIHAGLTDETRHSVTSRHLAMFENDSVVINTGRGAIVDQDALFAELASGRLRGGLDVLDDPDQIPPDHPARSWENLILTGHQIHLGWPRHGAPPTDLTKAQRYAVDSIRAFRLGEDLRWRIKERQYTLMT